VLRLKVSAHTKQVGMVATTTTDIVGGMVSSVAGAAIESILYTPIKLNVAETRCLCIIIPMTLLDALSVSMAIALTVVAVVIPATVLAALLTLPAVLLIGF
jgi:hypothetical protein